MIINNIPFYHKASLKKEDNFNSKMQELKKIKTIISKRTCFRQIPTIVTQDPEMSPLLLKELKTIQQSKCKEIQVFIQGRRRQIIIICTLHKLYNSIQFYKLIILKRNQILLLKLIINLILLKIGYSPCTEKLLMTIRYLLMMKIKG